MQSAPTGFGLESGYYQVSLNFYDLQSALVRGAFLSTGISLAFAFFVLVIMTRSFYLTILSLVSIFGIGERAKRVLRLREKMGLQIRLLLRFFLFTLHPGKPATVSNFERLKTLCVGVRVDSVIRDDLGEMATATHIHY
mgnify:CR=1 FL=1